MQTPASQEEKDRALPPKADDLPASGGSTPEGEEYDEYDEYGDWVEDDRPPRSPRRPEAILGILALLAAAALIVVLVLSIPYFRTAEEDPEALAHPQHVVEEDILKADPIETEPEETAVPTIPPERNPYNQRDFQYNRNNYLICTKQDSYPGIDVSAYQGDVDWEQVAGSGIRFAIVRLGYRGYGKAGKMVEDSYAKKNLAGAAEAGLGVGAYFFSQALNIQEVDEEIDFLLDILGDTHLDMPIILDWEIVNESARTVNMDARTLTDCLLHFCQVMEEKGYQPMVYFNWSQSRNLIYLHELEDYPFWLALYQDRMTYPYRVEMWQYTCTGKVPGIQGDVDINVFMPDFRKQ